MTGAALPPALAGALDALGLGAPGFLPPEAVREAARRGLAMRRASGHGGTAVGLARADALAGGKPQSPHDMRTIAAWFARFAYLRAREGWGQADPPSAGYVAWHLWGGDPGREWVEARRPDWAGALPGSLARGTAAAD